MSLNTLEIVLVGLNVDRDLRDAIIGDLIEAREALADARGPRIADRWVRGQILRSAPLFLLAAIRQAGLRQLAAIVGAALLALLTVTTLIRASMVLVSTMIAPETNGRVTLVALALDLGCGIGGGYLAARLGRSAPLIAAFVFGVLGVTLTSMSGGDGHGWYRPALLLLLVPATVTGGWLRARSVARRLDAA